MSNNDEMNTLHHTLEVRNWVLSLYEEKCSPLLHKLSTSIVPELCPHYGRYYKELLDECEKQIYELRTFVAHVAVGGFNHSGKNLLCNYLVNSPVLPTMCKSRDKPGVPFSFQSGPISQHNNAKIQLKNDATFMFMLRNTETEFDSWDEATQNNWRKYKEKMLELYDRRLEGIIYKTLHIDEIALISQQPIMMKGSPLSHISLITEVMGVSRYGIQLTETIIDKANNVEFELLFSNSNIIVLICDEPKEQLSPQAVNACMQQRLNGKDIIFVLHRRYESDAHTSSQLNFITNSLNKFNMFGREKVHVLTLCSADVEEKPFIDFERCLGNKIAENIKGKILLTVEQLSQLMFFVEQLLTHFVSLYSGSSLSDSNILKKSVTMEDVFERKLQQAEKTLEKDITELKKSSKKFLEEFVKDMIPYIEHHAASFKARNPSETYYEIISAVNSKFCNSFEGLYLEWVCVKRASFSQSMMDILLPIVNNVNLDMGKNSIPTPALLLEYARKLVMSEEQQTDDFKVTVANSGIVVSETLIRISIESSTKEGDNTRIRKAAYMDFLVHLMKLKADKHIVNTLSVGAFGVCTILKDYMLKMIRKAFLSYCTLARVVYPERPKVDYPMLCKLLYLRDDIARHLKKLNSILLSIPEFPIVKRIKDIVETYSFSEPGMCTMCLQKYTRCSHLCGSCSVNLQGRPCPFCNKWSHFSNELHSHVSNINNFIGNLARNELAPNDSPQYWANLATEADRSQLYKSISKNGKVIVEFQSWFMELLLRNDLTSTKSAEVFTCFINSIISKHTPPDCRNLPDQYQKIMMKCISDLFSEEFFPAVLHVFKQEYLEQDTALYNKMQLFKHYKASAYIQGMDSSVMDKLDLFKAVVEFNKVTGAVRPYDKCEHLLRCVQIVTNLFAQVQVLMGADLLLPCIVFIIVQSNVEKPVSEFFFLYQFMETHCVHFEQYILSTFYSVILSAGNLLDQLLLDQTESD